MEKKILETIKDRDAAFLKRFCQEGNYVSDGHVKSMIVCDPVDANDMLNFMHQWDAVLLEAVKKKEEGNK